MKVKRKKLIKVINEIIDEFSVGNARDFFQYSIIFGMPLHFEYEHGKWVCKKGA